MVHAHPSKDRLEQIPETVDEAEHAAARELSQALELLEQGRAALDDLPNLRGDEAWLGALEAAQCLGALHPDADLSEARRLALWSRLEGELRQRSVRLVRRQWTWRVLWSSVAAAALAGLLFVVFSSPSTQLPEAQLSQPSAVARLEQQSAHFAAVILSDSKPTPGDTKLRSLRNARFDAYQRDTSVRLRTSAGVNR